MTDMIENAIDHSLAIARRHAPVSDVAHGVLAALRRVRVAVEEAGGYSLVGILDGAIRDRLIIRSLRCKRVGEYDAKVALPPPGPLSPVAELILVASADTCLAYAAQQPDTRDLVLTVFIYLDRLIELLNGAPDIAELLAWMRNADEPNGPVEVVAVREVASLH